MTILASKATSDVQQADDIQDNEPWRWQDYLEKCWKKEFGEPRTRDDPGELSDDDEVFGKSSLTAPDFDRQRLLAARTTRPARLLSPTSVISASWTSLRSTPTKRLPRIAK